MLHAPTPLGTTDPPLKAFWAQPLLAGSWYDVFGMVALVREISRMRGVPYFTVVSEMSRLVALEDVRGIYRVLLRIATPELIAPRLPRIQARYMDFGDVTPGSYCQGRGSATRTGHPRILAHWYVAAVSGFIPCVLETAGAKNVRIRWDTPVVDGTAFGFETVSIHFEATWS